MFIYILIILVLFILSYNRKVSNTERIVYGLLAIFLCFGYMCGSDWRNYESEYYSNFSERMVEPGYMFLSNLFSNIGINFWFFHTIAKVICWCSFILLFKKIRPERSLGFPLMLFMPSFGFFLFIDCPFRNLISISICLLFLPCLENRRYILYIFGVLLASSFHSSALFCLFLPFININKFSNKTLVIVYVAVFIGILLGLDRIFIDKILSPFPFLQSKLSYYDGTGLSQGSLFSIGLILRLICLWGMLFFREDLYKEGKFFLFNLCYVYLLLSLLSYSIPILFRIPFFLSPFFVLMVSEIVDKLKGKNRSYARFFYLLVALIITVKTASSVYYVPYTNIIPYWVKGNHPTYSQRSIYNFMNSPYAKKK